MNTKTQEEMKRVLFYQILAFTIRQKTKYVNKKLK